MFCPLPRTSSLTICNSLWIDTFLHICYIITLKQTEKQSSLLSVMLVGTSLHQSVSGKSQKRMTIVLHLPTSSWCLILYKIIASGPEFHLLWHLIAGITLRPQRLARRKIWPLVMVTLGLYITSLCSFLVPLRQAHALSGISHPLFLTLKYCCACPTWRLVEPSMLI